MVGWIATGGVVAWLLLRNRACACPEVAAPLVAPGFGDETPAGGWQATAAPAVMGPAATPAPADVPRPAVKGSVVSAVICPDGYGPATVTGDGRVICPSPYGDGAMDGFCNVGSVVAVIDGKPRCRKA